MDIRSRLKSTFTKPDTIALVPKRIQINIENLSSMWAKFDPDLDYTVSRDDQKKNYRRRFNEIKTSIKWGQLKLLITELDFIIRYWDPDVIPNPTFLYVGAAKGTHIAALLELFPDITFELYDPNPFDEILSNYTNVRIYNKFFDDDIAQTYSNRYNVFFICDIRSEEYTVDLNETEPELTNEAIIADNMRSQEKWVRIIKPVKAHLKFRLPYVYESTETTSFKYLNGTVYKQAWAPQSSTECRLVPNDDLDEIDWDFRAHEKIMFFHNETVREKIFFMDPITGAKETPFKLTGLNNDYDSTLTLYIIKTYLERIGMVVNVDNTMKVAKYLINKANNGNTDLIGLRTSKKKFE